jgi:peptidoglycan/xylan/chitin deacetylase (PgdA/CDA1 family)
MKGWIGITLLLSALGIGLLAPTLQASRGTDRYEDQVAVLMYHHLDETAQSSSTVTPQLFRAQLELLKKQQYHFITLDQFINYLNGTASVPGNAALVTFDDGYKSFYTKAYPILRELQVPAVNFVITGNLEHPDQTYIPSLSRDDIRRMLAETPQLVSFGCHTDAMHDKLPNGEAAMVGRAEQNGQPETTDAYKQRVLADTRTCLAKLNELTPKPVTSLAYPFGITDRTATELVAQAGIRYAFTITPDMATRSVDPLRIPRINAGSPNITPEGLVKTILHRILPAPADGPVIVLSEVIRELGGSYVRDGNDLRLALGDERWTARIGSNRVVREGTSGSAGSAGGRAGSTSGSAGGTIELSRPIVLRSGEPVVPWRDLQAIVGPAADAVSPQTGRVTAGSSPHS